ncbi:hypothetical protein DPMN_116828 [Dreissena polymorpha]|uniref:Uncharacterized protein n=1 Tax=Dreissena polymorpha TaxID=45954 RepID=A0A9D4QTW5_DREPO|nr:hypothetical protein DPMN_116828 [Dreissena polymorpha]
MNEAKKAQEHLNSFFKKVSEQGIIPVTGDDNDKEKEQLQEKEDLKVQNRKLGDEILELKKKVEQEQNKIKELMKRIKAFFRTTVILKRSSMRFLTTFRNRIKQFKTYCTQEINIFNIFLPWKMM